MNLRLPLLAILLALATQAHATPATVAELSADLNGDGVKDRIVLLNDPDSSEDVDLAIYLSTGGKLPDQPTVYKKALGWTGDMAGTKPGLQVNAAGSLVVTFQNDAVGRERWSQKYTIAFRNGSLVVAGYDSSSHDTIGKYGATACDINFLAGKGTRDGKPIKVAPLPSLSAWTNDLLPQACLP